MSILNTIEEDIRRVLDDHSSVLEATLGDAAKVAASPLAQVALGLLHVTPAAQSAIADLLQELDNEFAKVAATTPAAAEPTAEMPNPTGDGGADSAAAASPVAAVAAPAGNGTGQP